MQPASVSLSNTSWTHFLLVLQPWTGETWQSAGLGEEVQGGETEERQASPHLIHRGFQAEAALSLYGGKDLEI